MMSPSDQAQIVEAFAALVEHHCPRGAGYEAIGHEDGGLWAALAGGGWLDIGALDAGEDALPLPVLAALMIEWGRRLPRLPLASAILARRRFPVAPEDATKHVIALHGVNGMLLPFGSGDGICLIDAAGKTVAADASGVADDFDPTLALARLPMRSGLVPDWSSELQVLLAGQAVGAAAEALDRASEYGEQRKAFGRPIASFQSLRHWLADMHIACEVAQSALLWAAKTTGTARARALGECSRQAQTVATKAIQVFGGVGCSWELGVHAYLRHTIAVREVVRAAQPGQEGDPPAADLGAMSDGDAAFRAEVSAWLDRVVPIAWRETTAERSAGEIAAMKEEWARIRQEGHFSGLRWPKAHGGRGLSPREVMIYYEECAKARVPEGVDGNPRAIGQDLAGPAIIAYGTEAQKVRHLPRILSGEEIWCEGFSEPGAGSDLAAVTTTATFDGAVYRINGSKIWTTYAHKADYCYLLAKTASDAPRRENLSVFLFDMRQPGVRVRPILNLVEEHDFNQVFFDDAVATPEDLLGDLNDGWKMVTIGAKALRSSGKDGGTTVAWQRCTQLATWLDRLEATVGDAGTIDKIAGLRARLDALRWTNARNAGIHDEEMWFPPVRGASNIVKLGISEVLQELTELGVATAPPEHQPFWRREFLLARARTIAGGSSQIQRDVIAKQVMHLRTA